MHHQMFFGEAGPDFVELDARGQHIDEKNIPFDQELQQADPRAVVKHVVRLCIEGHLVDSIQGRQKRRQLRGLFNQLERRRAGSHFHPEQTSKAERKEARNHA